MPGGTHEALPEWRDVLTPEAIAFVNDLADRFSGERAQLLARRATEEGEFDAGKLPDFPAETRELRAADWRVAAVPKDLLDRRVEITGPPERKMVDTHYREVLFPFAEISVPPFALEQRLTRAGFEGYLRTWSATNRYRAARRDDPVDQIAPVLNAEWSNPDEPRPVRWPMFVRAGRIRM